LIRKTNHFTTERKMLREKNTRYFGCVGVGLWKGRAWVEQKGLGLKFKNNLKKSKGVVV
jgi:hypothetical protein